LEEGEKWEEREVDEDGKGCEAPDSYSGYATARR